MEIRLKIAKGLDQTRQFFVDFFRTLFFDKIFRNYLLINFSAISASAALAWLFASRVGDEQIIMHYNISFGVDYIADAQMLYYFPLLGLVFYLVSLSLAYIFNRNDKFFIHIYMVGSWFANNLIIATLISLYLINFR